MKFDEAVPVVNNDEDLQGMWKGMESRVTKRLSLTLEQAEKKGKVGRKNVRKTDEEMWLAGEASKMRGTQADGTSCREQAAGNKLLRARCLERVA